MSETLVSAVLLIPVAIVSLTTGIGIALASCIAHDKQKCKQMENYVKHCDSWCQCNCKKFDECYSNHEDPDDAWKELEDYCCECPLAKAVEILEKDGSKK